MSFLSSGVIKTSILYRQFSKRLGDVFFFKTQTRQKAVYRTRTRVGTDQMKTRGKVPTEPSSACVKQRKYHRRRLHAGYAKFRDDRKNCEFKDQFSKGLLKPRAGRETYV